MRRRLTMPMPDHNNEVLERVRSELARRPHLSLGVLHHLALTIDPSVGPDPRAFHAHYVAPLKHEAARAQRQRRKGRAGKEGATATTEKPLRPVQTPRGTQAPAPTEAPPAPSPKEEPQSLIPTPALEADRGRIRSTLLQFAHDLAAADTRAEFTRVLVQVDRYADQAVPPEPRDRTRGEPA